MEASGSIVFAPCFLFWLLSVVGCSIVLLLIFTLQPVPRRCFCTAIKWNECTQEREPCSKSSTGQLSLTGTQFHRQRPVRSHCLKTQWPIALWHPPHQHWTRARRGLTGQLIFALWPWERCEGVLGDFDGLIVAALWVNHTQLGACQHLHDAISWGFMTQRKGKWTERAQVFPNMWLLN